jgi:hypothetical protein
VTSAQPPATGWRLKLSAALFGLSILLPLVGIPIVAVLGLSKTITASVSGGLLLTGEILGITAVAIIGKSGYALIKRKIFGFLRQYGPPQKVSRRRYRIGLVMFCAPLLFGWGSIYAGAYIPGFSNNPILYGLGGDLLLLASLFVLGGDFWDKIHSLFIHNAEVRYLPPLNGDRKMEGMP